MELNRQLEISKEKEKCEFCVDCGNDACFACTKANGIKVDELREYYAAVKNALRRTAEYDKAREEGRLVVLPCKVGTPIWWIDVSIEPNERGKWVTRNRIKAMKFDHSVLDLIDTPFYLTRIEAEAALGGGDK